MKTSVREILINGDFGPVSIRIRMPNGDLKRRYLYRLFEYGVVIPDEKINKILYEVLDELNEAYRTIKALNGENNELLDEIEGNIEDACVQEEKYLGDIEELESRIAELQDDVSDLEAELAALHQENESLKSATPYSPTEGRKSVH